MEDHAEVIALSHYYRQAYACLLENRFETREERNLFFTNVLNQIVKDFHTIVASQTLSRLVERFFPQASLPQLATLIKLFFEDESNPDRYVIDRTGSQVLQACLTELHRFAADLREHGERPEESYEPIRTVAQLVKRRKTMTTKPPSTTKSVKSQKALETHDKKDDADTALLTDKDEIREVIHRATAYLWNQLFAYSEDVYASHLIRVLLELLAGANVSVSIVRSSASSSFQQRSNTALQTELSENKDKQNDESNPTQKAKGKQPISEDNRPRQFSALAQDPQQLFTNLVRRILKGQTIRTVQKPSPKPKVQDHADAHSKKAQRSEQPFPGTEAQRSDGKRALSKPTLSSSIANCTAVNNPESYFAAWLVSPIANPVLQTIALVTRHCAPAAFERLFHALLAVLERDVSLANHEVASYAIETFLNGARDDAKLLRAFYDKVLGPRVAEFARGSFSNYVLGALVRCIAPHDAAALGHCFEEVGPVVSRGDSALSLALLRAFSEAFASARSDSHARTFIDHVMNIIKRDCGLLTSEGVGGDATLSGSTESCVIQWILMPHVQATQRSMLVQSLLRFSVSTSRRIIDAFLELSADRFVQVACHRTASRCVEAFFRTESVKNDAKKRFVDRLCDATGSDQRFLQLACDTFGSRCIETVFAACDAQARWRIADLLSRNLAKLKQDRIGTYQCRNMRLDYLLTAGKTRWIESFAGTSGKRQQTYARSYTHAKTQHTTTFDSRNTRKL